MKILKTFEQYQILILEVGEAVAKPLNWNIVDEHIYNSSIYDYAIIHFKTDNEDYIVSITSSIDENDYITYELSFGIENKKRYVKDGEDAADPITNLNEWSVVISTIIDIFNWFTAEVDKELDEYDILIKPAKSIKTGKTGKQKSDNQRRMLYLQFVRKNAKVQQNFDIIVDDDIILKRKNF